MDVLQTLLRLGRVVVGDQHDPGVLDSALGERLRTAPVHVRRQLSLAVRIMDSRLANLVVAGRFVRLSAARDVHATRLYERWLMSRLGVARSISQGIRRFILSTYYAQPEVQAALGVKPPLYQRAAAFDWEGAVRGTARDDVPVARLTTGGLPDELRQPRRKERTQHIHSAAAWSGTHYFRADVVIVGSGAGGSVAAARLAEAGRDVLVVERGRWVERADFSEREDDIGADLYADRGLRTTTDSAITLLQGAALGGGTTVNWLLMLRTPDHVLEEWRRDHGTEGMTPADMRPVFERIERELHATLVPDDAHNPPNRMLLRGARALGWHVETARINARGCVRAGTCSLGCRYGAKQSAIETYLPRAIAAGARVMTDAAVERVVVTARDTGRGAPPQKRLYVTLRGSDGRVSGEVQIDAPVVLLAAGAVETPLLLQRSGFGGGGVGRFLRLHPTTALLARMPNVVYPLAGVPQTTVCAEFARKHEDYGFWIECPALTPGLAAAAASGIGASHRSVLEQLSHLAPLIVLVRDAGDGGSVTSGRGGMPRIRYALAPRERQLVCEGVAAAARIALAGGAEEVSTLHTRPIVVRTERDLAAILSAELAPNDMTMFSAHVNGTCRIGRTATDAGVLPNGQRFGVRGLYVVDGSIVPTAPGVNPQETIYALATVLAERMLSDAVV